MAHLTSIEFCPVFDKSIAKGRLCVCSGVLIMVTYGHDRFFVTVTSRMDIIHDVTKWAVHLCSEIQPIVVISFRNIAKNWASMAYQISKPLEYEI